MSGFAPETSRRLALISLDESEQRLRDQIDGIAAMRAQLGCGMAGAAREIHVRLPDIDLRRLAPELRRAATLEKS